MISATSLSSASSPHSLSKPGQIPMLENGRLLVERLDSQKFLVPSLPVSNRALNNDPSNKRRERSILNGTGGTHANSENNHHHNHHHHHHHHHNSNSNNSGNNNNTNNSSSNNGPTNHVNGLNGLRRSYSGSQLHQPQLHTSPRKDAQSPLYNGESNPNSNNSVHTGIPSNPSNFAIRSSSMPIPCSSPSPGSSASPNKSHSPSSSSLPSNANNTGNGPYTPQLPPGLSDLAAAARLYPGFHHHGGLGHPVNGHPAAHLPFYAAASHSLPYPIFGAHSYNHHSGSSYLENYPNMLAVPTPQQQQQQQQQQMRSSPSPSPPRTQQGQQQQQQQSSHSPRLSRPQTTSTTSLHSHLIESVSSGERYNGHNHLQPPTQQQQQHHSSHSHNISNITNSNNNSRFSNGGPGVSKGISNMGGPQIERSINNSLTHQSNTTSSGGGGGAVHNKIVHHHQESSSDKSFISPSSSVSGGGSTSNNPNSYCNGGRNSNNGSKVWNDSPSSKSHHHQHHYHHNNNNNSTIPAIMSNGNVSHMKDLEMDPHSKDFVRVPRSLKHHILTRSPDNLATTGATSVKSHHKNQHQFSPSDLSTSSSSSPMGGVLVDSNNVKLNNHINNNNTSSGSNNNSNSSNNNSPSNPFLPPSPKKRSSGQWNFAVPNSKIDLPPPSSPSSLNNNNNNNNNNNKDSMGDSFKYLSNPTVNKNPSSNHTININGNNNNSNHSGSSNNISHQSPPYLMTPPSSTTSAQQFHFQFPNLKSTIQNGSNSNSPKSSSNGNQSPLVVPSHVYMSAPSTPTYHSSSSSSSSTPSSLLNNSKSIKLNSNHHHHPHPPVQVEQMPVIDAFRRGSLVALVNGDRKPVEDLNAEDFIITAAVLSDSISIIHCTVLAINMESNNSLCKVTLSMGSHNQQVIVDATAEQPFFVMGRGWASGSPAKTEKKLQLSCSPLCVGDVCITLTRNPNSSHNNNNNSPTTPKTTNGKVTTKGTNYNSSPKSRNNGGTAKGSSRLNSSSVAATGRTNNRRLNSNTNNTNNNSNNNNNNKASMSNGNVANFMPPPPSPLSQNSQQHHHQQPQPHQNGQSITVSSVVPVSKIPKSSTPPHEPLTTTAADENEQPCSKKRRWSAPDAVIEPQSK